MPCVRILSFVLALSLLSACGGGGGSQSPTDLNSVPVAFDISEKTNVNETLSGMLNASDSDGDPLTYSITALPTLGTVDLTNASTGEFRYTPTADAFGTEVFRYRVNDGKANSGEAAVTVVINRLPIAESMTIRAATSQPKNATLAGRDDDGDPMTFQIATPPANGSVSNLDAGTGEFVYTANGAFEGTDTFTYTVNDGFADSTTATVTVEVDEWPGTMNLGLPGDESVAYGLGIDDNDNLYVSFSTDGAITGATSAGGTDVVLSKIDRTGAIVWQKQWGFAGNEAPYQIAMDPNGFLYLTVHTDVGAPTGPNYVLKFDLDGNLVWQFVAPDPDRYSLLYRMAVAPSGNVYVTLRSSEGGVLRVNADGTLGWLKRLGTVAEDPADPLLPGDYSDYFVQVRGLAVDASETTYVYITAGYTPTSTGQFEHNGIYVTLDSNGSIQTRVEPMVVSANPGAIPSMGDVQITADANLRMTGFLGQDLVVAEFDVAGNEIWSTVTGDPGLARFGFRGALDASGNTIATGTLSPETGEPPEADDEHVTKISAQGVFVWDRIIDSSPADGSVQIADNQGQPVVDSDGDIFMVITSQGGSLGAQPNQGGFDPLLMKLDGSSGEIVESD